MTSVANSSTAWASCIAAQWAQEIGLPLGNAWEPAVARNIAREFQQLGSDANARAFVTATWRIRLGLKTR